MKAGFWIGLLSCLLLRSAIPAQETPIADLIARAGNAEREQERYRLLEQLSKRPGLSPGLRSDLDSLLPVIDRWANGREKYWTPTETRRAAENGYLCGFFYGKARIDRDYPLGVGETSPLYPIWCMYRSRMLIQRPIQGGSGQTRQAYYGEGRRLMKVARNAFPNNRVLGMYLEQPIPWPPLQAPDSNAPDWANHQREALEKLADIIYFWIDERQAPDGQYGGGWGDDVEMWRSWTPILIGFEDPKVNAAQAKLSNGLFALNRMGGGYTSLMSDVEHTGEDSGDAGTAMMHVDPDNAVWQARAIRLAELMRDLWTGRNRRGLLQFKSTYFTSEKVHPDSQRACDTVYHPRAVQPALLYWQRTRDPDLTTLFSAWMDTWVDATARQERGKPEGILPSAIHWPDGQVGGLGKDWWDPRNHDQPTLYRWPSAMSMMTNTLLLTHHITGEEAYLGPITSMAAHRAAYRKHPVKDAEPGSAMWCARRMGFLSGTLGKYRLITGDTRFDDLLLKDANGYVQFRLSGDRKRADRSLKRTAEAFRVNREAYTTEVRWTDRVFAFHSHYANRYADSPLARPSLDMLYCTVTGDFGSPLYFPLNAVRWKTTPQDIAALVTDNSTTFFHADLYHFGDTPRSMGADLYLLEPGTYTWTLTTGLDTVSSGLFTVQDRRSQIAFSLPPQRLCTLQIRRQ